MPVPRKGDNNSKMFPNWLTDKKKEVPKLLSIINNRAADKSTGNEIAPMMAVTKNAQIVRAFL